MTGDGRCGGRRDGGRRAALQGQGHRCGHVLCSSYGVLLAVFELLDVLGDGVLRGLSCFVGEVERVHRALHLLLEVVELVLVIRHPVGGCLSCCILLGGDVGQGVGQLCNSVLVSAVDRLNHACGKTSGLLAAVLDVGHQGLVVLLCDAQIIRGGGFQCFDVGGVGVPVVELRVEGCLRVGHTRVHVVARFRGGLIEEIELALEAVLCRLVCVVVGLTELFNIRAHIAVRLGNGLAIGDAFLRGGLRSISGGGIAFFDLVDFLAGFVIGFLQFRLFVQDVLQRISGSIGVGRLLRPLCRDRRHPGRVLCVEVGDVVLVDLLRIVGPLLGRRDFILNLCKLGLLVGLLLNEIDVLLVLLVVGFLLRLFLSHLLDVGEALVLVFGQVFVGHVQAVDVAVQLVENGLHFLLFPCRLPGRACQLRQAGDQREVFQLIFMHRLRVVVQLVHQGVVLVDQVVTLGNEIADRLPVAVQRLGQRVDAVLQRGRLIGRVAVGVARGLVLLLQRFQLFPLLGSYCGHGLRFLVGVLVLVAQHGDSGGYRRDACRNTEQHRQIRNQRGKEPSLNHLCGRHRSGQTGHANGNRAQAGADRGQGLHDVRVLSEEVPNLSPDVGQLSRRIMDSRLQNLSEGNIHLVVGLLPLLAQTLASLSGFLQRAHGSVQRSRQGVGRDRAVADSPCKVNAHFAAENLNGLRGRLGAVLHVGDLGYCALQSCLCIQAIRSKLLDSSAHGGDRRGSLDAVELHLSQQADRVLQRQAQLLQGRCARNQGIAQSGNGQAGNLARIGQIIENARQFGCVHVPLVHYLGDELDGANDILASDVRKV